MSFRITGSEIPIALPGTSKARTSIVEDPVYLTEPLIKSENFLRAVRPQEDSWVWPCESVSEVDRSPEDVPHYLPGANPYIDEFAIEHGIPIEATRGGAETMHPDYRAKMATMKKNPAPAATK